MHYPFVGMDPYMESSGLWRNFHANLMIRIQDTLADLVPQRYLVRAEERSYLLLAGEDGKEEHDFFPDVRVIEPQPSPRKKSKRRPSAASVTTAVVSVAQQPMQLSAFIEQEVRETFIDIFVQEPDYRLITTIEVLSPTNKERGGHGWNLYLRKRQGAMVCGVHLVEIDLLRGGTRMPMRDAWPNGPYTLLVARAHQHLRCDVWPAYFHLPLPPIPIPLAAPDPDVALALQPIVESIYGRLRYAATIDYDKPLHPRLTPTEQKWLKQARKTT
jgi:hypothetical protein